MHIRKMPFTKSNEIQDIFAKRQITWFKREKHVTWINKKDYNYDEDKILEVMLESIKKDILEEQSC